MTMTASVETAADFHALVAAIEQSPIVVPEMAVTALSLLRDGVLTGEGPTVAGRAHFSRTLDKIDAANCGRILMAAGGAAGGPVTREEAEMLMAIDAAAHEREDQVFDDLFVKAVTHHVLAATGRPVPPRPVALSADTPLSSWAGEPRAHDVDHEILEWIMSHVRGSRHLSQSLMSIAALVIGTPIVQSLSGVLDFAA
jgi:hypothetical protein